MLRIDKNISNIKEKFLVVKKRREGLLYYSTYRKTGSVETYYATLYTKEEAEKKLAQLKERTKGKFDIIPAKDVFCNDWSFSLATDYSNYQPYIRVTNSTVAVEKVKKGTKVRDATKALANLKKQCEDQVASNLKDIERKQKEIENINNVIKTLTENSNNITNAPNDLEQSLRQIVEDHTVPADTVVSVLFGDING